MSYAFDPQELGDLPEIIPVFPLPGATLLPRTQLPLNIFEPRYLHMVFDALGGHRCIGMIQPGGDATEERPALSQVGCLGRITGYNETEDGRLLINLHGVCRFHVEEELESLHGYRRVRAGWQDYLPDLREDSGFSLERAAFKATMSTFFDDNGIRVDWEGLDKMPDERVVNFLAMHLPFASQEKQALLEAKDVEARYQVLIAVATMASPSAAESSTTLRH